MGDILGKLPFCMKQIFTNTQLNCSYNPFGGIEDDELSQVLVARTFVPEIIQDIQSGVPMVIELSGKQGRGKTSHLRLISLLFPDAPRISLYDSTQIEPFWEEDDSLLFIDSIHHLNFFQRQKLFKSGKTIVLTTHSRRFWEYRLAGAAYRTYVFKGISPSILKTTIQNRIHLAADIPPNDFSMQESDIQALIARFGDNYRAILNHLFEQFNQHLWKKNL